MLLHTENIDIVCGYIHANCFDQISRFCEFDLTFLYTENQFMLLTIKSPTVF